MARNRSESVIGIINALEQMKGVIETTPYIIAEEFLRSTIEDAPRPPIRTGALRRSGAAYVGNELVITTEELGDKYPNIEALLYPVNDDLFAGDGGGENTGISVQRNPTSSLRSRQITSTRRVSGTMKGTSLRGNVSVVYSNPVAALMHEWKGGFSDPTGQSGAHYVSSKATAFRGKTQTRLKQLFDTTVTRRGKA